MLPFLFVPRTAGTVGAVATCPLEVVKTRLQSSSAFLSTKPNGSNGSKSVRNGAATNFSAPQTNGGGASNDAMLKPEQRRRLCTTIFKKRPQVRITDIKGDTFLKRLVSGDHDILLWNLIVCQIIEYCTVLEVSKQEVTATPRPSLARVAQIISGSLTHGLGVNYR